MSETTSSIIAGRSLMAVTVTTHREVVLDVPDTRASSPPVDSRAGGLGVLDSDRPPTPPGRGSNSRMTDAFPEGLVPGSAQSRTPQDFDQMYGGTPPWEIGRPQPVFLRLADNGTIP